MDWKKAGCDFLFMERADSGYLDGTWSIRRHQGYFMDEKETVRI